jgi:hypothetical protein
MTRIQFDAGQPNLDALRQVIFEHLRRQPDLRQLDVAAFAQHVELTPPRHDDQRLFKESVLEVFWQLTVEGVVAPGLATSESQMGFPWFRVTEHGRSVLADVEYVPHDRQGYLALLREKVGEPDPVVLAYLVESLETYARNSLVASTVMLGVAAERVFDLLCDSALAALKDPNERKIFTDRLNRNAMMPKLDWLRKKFQKIQDDKIAGFPENVALMVNAIYDLIRTQRNDLGHPSNAPPRPSQSQAYANLLVFPPYYERAEVLRKFLASNSI